MLRIYKPTPAEGDVEVELDNGQRLTGSVAWARQWEIGIAFADPIDVDAALSAPSLPQLVNNRRAMPRTTVSCPVQLRLRTRVLKARINNISEVGASVETLRPLSGQSRVELTLPDLPAMTGSVQWSSGNSAGLKFDEPIPAEVLADWLNARLT